MVEPDTHWEGQSGKEYRYWIHPIGTDFTEDPGNYIYAKQVEPGRWEPLWIGQTSNLHDLLVDPEKAACAKRNGATHVHAHTSPGRESARAAEEADLIARWDPPCNR